LDVVVGTADIFVTAAARRSRPGLSGRWRADRGMVEVSRRVHLTRVEGGGASGDSYCYS
jgi:hypothetical protein